MRKFVLKTLYFSIPILGLVLALEMALRNIPNNYRYKNEYLKQNAESIETLILGSSHAFYGLDPSYFSSNCFNASHISQYLNYDLAILKKYEERLIHLKTLVLPISYFSFYGSLEESPEAWRVKNYVLYYGLASARSYTDYSEVFSNSNSTNLKRIYAYYIQGEAALSCNNLGWGTDFSSDKAKDLIKSGRLSAQRHSKAIHDEKYENIFQNNKETLSSITSWCEEREVQLLLFTPPAYASYRKHLNPEQLNPSLQVAEQLALKNAHCSYINLLEDNRFVAADFYDADHLSEVGAKKLSMLLNNKINDLD